MNLNLLIKKHFADESGHLNIEMFDAENIYVVYQEIVGGMMRTAEINLSVLQALGYCLYEILDNVLIHSGKQCGIVVHSFNAKKKTIKILIVDDGIGICESLRQNVVYKNIMEREALRICINDSVSDGYGMGFGLYSMSRLVEIAGLDLRIHSGNTILRYKDKDFIVEDSDFWKGTQVYLELHSDIDIDANSVVDNRTDAAGDFNDTFITDNELW